MEEAKTSKVFFEVGFYFLEELRALLGGPSNILCRVEGHRSSALLAEFFQKNNCEAFGGYESPGGAQRNGEPHGGDASRNPIRKPLGEGFSRAQKSRIFFSLDSLMLARSPSSGRERTPQVGCPSDRYGDLPAGTVVRLAPDPQLRRWHQKTATRTADRSPVGSSGVSWRRRSLWMIGRWLTFEQRRLGARRSRYPSLGTSIGGW
jgi:hypothetical protein